MNRPYWNPYLAGAGLGFTLILAYLVLGTGLGASGGIARIAAQAAHVVAPAATESNAVMGEWFEGGSSLGHYLVFMLFGTFLGGAISAFAAGRSRWMVERGDRLGPNARLGLALVGGVLAGLGARFASGCTSGQALSGGAMLQVGSFVFLGATFAAGFGLAPLLRRAWR
jgi:uncharacterized membrane protein YedE/YeeE